MIKKLAINIFIFLIVFIIITIIADLYYYNRVIQKDSANKNQICYSDFRVLWFAAYNLRHHILKVWNQPKGRPTFRPFWFLDSKLRKQAYPIARTGEYTVYKNDKKYYHYRYTPFVAFFMMPLGKISHQGHALLIWYIILNIAFLSTLLLMRKQINTDFGLNREHRYLILWSSFLVSLRFYLMNISLGQTDIIVAFLFVLFLMAYVRNKEILCGILFALILQFKLFFLPMLAYFLFIGKRKLILSTIIGFVCFLFIPAYMIGIEKLMLLLRDWIEILSISISSQILNAKNQSIVYAMSNLLLKTDCIKNFFTSPKYLFYFLSMGLLLFSYAIMARFRKSVKSDNEKKYKYLELPILIITSLLFSPIAWEAHFITLIIPLGAAIFFTVTSVKRGVLYSVLGVFFILSCVVGTDLTKFIPCINELNFMNIAVGALFLAFAVIYGYKQSVK
ncbi:MAG: DUF2029 domain-containing protein [Candidatus Omnitrophica bacterium]|nr:DUF2029 domain-containing protein [Candidatus Omnitrophota bacterium]